MIGRRTYYGDSIDAGYQHISEAPAYQDDGETVYATDPEDAGTERTENVPVLDSEEQEETEQPAVDGQTTLSDWRWLV